MFLCRECHKNEEDVCHGFDGHLPSYGRCEDCKKSGACVDCTAYKRMTPEQWAARQARLRQEAHNRKY